jgi:hypothetical protein
VTQPTKLESEYVYLYARLDEARAGLREAEALISHMLTDENNFELSPRARFKVEGFHRRLSELVAWPPRQG